MARRGPGGRFLPKPAPLPFRIVSRGGGAGGGGVTALNGVVDFGIPVIDGGVTVVDSH